MRAAAGADGWRAAELRAFPKDFWHSLAEFLGVCEEVGKWPEPLRAGLAMLTPRPIALLPLVYRIWAAARRRLAKFVQLGPWTSLGTVS